MDNDPLHMSDEWSNLLAIYLLEMPRKPNEIHKVRFPIEKHPKKGIKLEELYKTESQYLTRKGVGHLWNLNQLGLLKQREKRKSRSESYDINFSKLSELLFEPLKSRRIKISNLQELIDKTTEILSENREFLFEFDTLKMLFGVQNDVFPSVFPSIRGLINTSIGYATIVDRICYHMDQAMLKLTFQNALLRTSSNIYIANVRFLTRLLWLKKTGMTSEDFDKIELDFIRAKVNQYRTLYQNRRFMADSVFAFYIDVTQGSMVWGKPGDSKWGFYKPLTHGIRVQVTKKEIESYREGDDLYKSPFDLEDFNSWLELQKYFE